jgi:hypothetical protein
MFVSCNKHFELVVVLLDLCCTGSGFANKQMRHMSLVFLVELVAQTFSKSNGCTTEKNFQQTNFQQMLQAGTLNNGLRVHQPKLLSNGLAGASKIGPDMYTIIKITATCEIGDLSIAFV